MTAGILVFLAIQSVPAFKAVGLRFFTTSSWFISTNQFGIAAILPDAVLIALIALIIAIPVGLASALFISEYAPPRLRRALIAMIDLMAATPSIIVALFGLYFLMPRILGVEAWLAHHLGFIPVFRFSLSNFPGNYVGSTFAAGVVVSILVIPIITALSRQVFSQAPQGEREAAYALGSTRWGMIRTVVLPYGRAGMIFHVLQSGGNSPTFMIASHILEAGSKEISALMAAGMTLFVMTLLVNTVAAIIINRSRSGATASAD